MSIHFPDEQSKGFLIAAARNDNQIWIIDISKEQATKILPMNFYAPPIDDKCTSAYKMHNSSIEGVARFEKVFLNFASLGATTILQYMFCGLLLK